MSSSRPFVLFVCRHNTGRSQMAEAYLRHFAGDAIEVASAGTEAADAPDPGVVAAMAEDGIDISHARPKLLDAALASRADRIVTMGCDVTGVPRIDDDWGLPDPRGESPERVREIRDVAKTRARNLASSLMPNSPAFASLSARQPYRLDLTVAALRRVPGNVVDVMAPGAPYRRALRVPGGIAVIDVRQTGPGALDVRISGHDANAQIATVEKMLGTQVDLRTWYERTERFPWLERLADELRGLKPPRYPQLWEALCHGIIFQQLSIHAAAAIMQRFVERFSEPFEHDGAHLYAFPDADAIHRAGEDRMLGLGLSRQKVAYLRNAAESVLSGAIDAPAIERLPSDEASLKLQTIGGIGRWTAANILLRGFGRLDVFPRGDSGVAQGIKTLSGDPHIVLEDVLAALGDARGMLYFHLLLGRLRQNA